MSAVLVLAPHPDDESLGCGGTIKLLTESGTPVDVLYVTRGELGLEAPETATAAVRHRLAEVRSAEATAACRVLGVRAVDFLDGTDGRLAEQPHLATELRSRLRTGRYARTFCPGPQERHPDHLATYRLLQEALRDSVEPLQIWLYEVWTPLLPTVFVPIDGTIEAKLAAIRCHESQLACLDYLAAFHGFAAYRSLFCAGSRFAEAFIAADREAVLRDH